MNSFPRMPTMQSGKRKSSPIEIGSDSDVDFPGATAAQPTKKAKSSKKPVAKPKKSREDILSTKCGCKTGCKGSCACVKNGLGCGPSCRCATCTDDRGKCTNRLNDMFEALGEGDDGERLQADPCFAAWVARCKTPIDLDYLAECLDMEDDAFEFDDRLADWLKVSMRMTEGSEELRKHVGELVRYAILKDNRGDKMWYYSFCGGKSGRPTTDILEHGCWLEDENSWHCEVCKTCMDWREWHCDKCNKCTYGVSIPCRCGEVSSVYDMTQDGVGGSVGDGILFPGGHCEDDLDDLHDPSDLVDYDNEQDLDDEDDLDDPEWIHKNPWQSHPSQNLNLPYIMERIAELQNGLLRKQADRKQAESISKRR